MAVNIRLSERREHDIRNDPLGREWFGWDPACTDEELWAHNRGDYRLGNRVENERVATLSYRGVIRVVVELEGYEDFVIPKSGVTKQALIGTVLRPGDPLRDALVGELVPPGRNPVAYVETSHVDDMSMAQRAQLVDREPAAYLLTWNPDRWTMEPGVWERDVETIASGGMVRGQWSTGNRTSGIEAGDRAWLLRQGTQGRGLVASGTFTSKVFVDEHWNDTDREANYALVEWDTLIAPADALQTEQLRAQFPAQHWEPESSGTIVRSEVQAEVEQLWADHVGHPVPPSRPKGQRQGWQLDPVRRKKVENAAQDRLMDYYRDDLKWQVDDVRFTESYDAIATKGDETLYLEAKGTETEGRSVIVSRGEVSHARQHPGQCVLGVLSDVRFDDAGEVDPISGVFRIFDWNPDDGALEPRDHDWTPGAEPRVHD